ncbi:ergothioneine biosynthesis protein EgtB [Lysobacter sp. A421]
MPVTIDSRSLSAAATVPPCDLAARYRDVRARSLALAAPLSAEDAMVQSMADASPSKWHLAHTTWFFERFVLGARDDYQPLNAAWDYLFNSYYQSIGPMHERTQRGLLSRPTLAQVLDYRDQVDARMAAAFLCGDFESAEDGGGGLLQRIELGLHHEQQHQELLLTDIKHALWCNPLKPAYRTDLQQPRSHPSPLEWIGQDEAIIHVGAPPWPNASDVFAYDNESPRHRVLMPSHALASRPVSNVEYRAFIDDGGYRNPALWLSAGWAQVSQQRWCRPLYWEQALEREFTLGGLREIDPHAPACHLSYFEADAFARWAGARLPTEFEWEHAAQPLPVDGNFVDDDRLQPLGVRADGRTPRQMFGDVWEWTSSSYNAYPGFREMPGALGEYNGKFMCGQQVLRGGSCVSPADHLRASYRNFFYPPDRWQFSGLRLARDA